VCAKDLRSLGPAFYGLRTSLLTLLLMALWRIKRPEASRNTRRRTWDACWVWIGHPKSKRLRRKLGRLAAVKRAAEFGQALAPATSCPARPGAGFLYTDGHVRVYHGQYTLPRPTWLACVSRCRQLRITGSTIVPGPAVRRDCRGQCRVGQNAARHPRPSTGAGGPAAPDGGFLIAAATAPNSSSRSSQPTLIC